MKSLYMLFLASAISIAFIHLDNPILNNDRNATNQIKVLKGEYAGCSPNLSTLNFADSANLIPLLDGWGKYRMKVTTGNDSADIYFQQGINMYYGFHIIEALASFEKALKFDPNFTMGYWGKALAYGPNINDIGYSASPEAIEAVQKAKSLYANSPALEKALVDAMEIRYSIDTSQKREHLNQLYADAMKKVYTSFPTSADAAALYADALMVQHPWDLYDRDYNPKPWTPEIVAVLESLVKKFPENPGANHYYIHAVEGSKNPQKGLEVADRLGALMPAVSHLVHMPSHIYIRSGQYAKGAEVNSNAIKGYYNYLSKFPAVSNSTFIYLVHNQHMQAACAAMDGRYKNALAFSYDTQKSVDSTWLDGGGYFGYYAQYMYMTPLFTLTRFGKWDEILQASTIPGNRIFASIVWHYSRGLAYARTRQFEQAEKELQQLLVKKADPQLTESPAAFNPGLAATQVAEKVLNGVIAEEKGQLQEAIKILKEAVSMEDGMLYNEPKDWILPVRQYLGQTLLKAKQYEEAEKVYRQDLMINPNNGWSLTGLHQALTKQNKRNEAQGIQQQLKKALKESDVQIKSSVF